MQNEELQFASRLVAINDDESFCHEIGRISLVLRQWQQGRWTSNMIPCFPGNLLIPFSPVRIGYVLGPPSFSTLSLCSCEAMVA